MPRDAYGRFTKGNIEPNRNKFSQGNKLGLKHGQCTSNEHSPFWRIWRSMKVRCCNPNNEHWSRYGGRGITICNEWLSNFLAFYEWAKDLWKPGLQIDRIDNDGNYTPNNCRFVTAKENMRNQPRTKMVCIDGETISIFDAAENYGIVSATLINNRLHKGWSDIDAVTWPHRKQHAGKWTPEFRKSIGAKISEGKKRSNVLKGVL
jgi:hypothetical protein